MKQTAVEWLWEKIDNTIPYQNNETAKKFNELLEQAKEMEKQQKGYSEEEVIEFGKFLTEFNNLDNEIECAIKKLLEQFKNK